MKLDINELNTRLQPFVGKSVDTIYSVTSIITNYITDIYGEEVGYVHTDVKSHTISFRVYQNDIDSITVKYKKEKDGHSSSWYGNTYNWKISRIECIYVNENIDNYIKLYIDQENIRKKEAADFDELTLNVSKVIIQNFPNLTQDQLRKICSNLVTKLSSWRADSTNYFESLKS